MRRSRFTATFEDGTKKVVLSYTAQQARGFYEARGLTVVSVTRGDYRALAEKIGGGFRIDKAALDAAVRELGLNFPIDIRFNGRVGLTHANHQFKCSRHRIMLKRYLKPEQASKSLWHELAHARQAENAVLSGRTWHAVVSEQRQYSYSARPIEVEARAVADAHDDKPLCIAP